MSEGETEGKTKLVAIRFSDDELQLLAEAQTIIAKIAKNSDLRVTQRAAIVSALRLFVQEKTRRK